MSGAQLCMSPTMPDIQRCSQYTLKDAAMVTSSGGYSAPLGVTITVNAQGLWCTSGVTVGETYVPILVRPGAVERTTITQVVTITSLTTAQYTGDLKLVYETGYAIAIGIWSNTTRAMMAGCQVSSTVSSSRRAAAISFTATVSNNPTLANAASQEATTLVTNPAALITGINTAKVQLNRPNVAVPAASAVSVAQPTVTTAQATASTSGAMSTIPGVAGLLAMAVLLVQRQ